MTYQHHTTLNGIRAAGPCSNGWTKLLKHLGKTQADDEPLSILTILDSNGLDDALWCLRVPSLDRLSRHFEAWDAARAAASDAAWGAAWDAARAAASDAAWDAARAAAWDAAWDAARAAQERRLRAMCMGVKECKA